MKSHSLCTKDCKTASTANTELEPLSIFDKLAGDMVYVEQNTGSFHICKYEVTQKLWSAVMEENPSDMQGDDLPVEQVSWNDCQRFISKLNELTGKKYRLPSGLDIDKLQDCTVPAAFTPNDFRWMGGNLRMTVYSKDLYDAVEVSQMQVGDTLIYESERMVIEKMEEAHGVIDINGGLDEGGCCLVGYEGGTYVARNWDDHSTYTRLGSVEVALAEDSVIKIQQFFFMSSLDLRL